MTAIASLLLSSVPPAPSAAAVETIDLGNLTWLDARQLDGRRVRVRFTVDAGSGCSVFSPAPGRRYCCRSPGARRRLRRGPVHRLEKRRADHRPLASAEACAHDPSPGACAFTSTSWPGSPAKRSSRTDIRLV